jgi:hypothetical protein
MLDPPLLGLRDVLYVLLLSFLFLLLLIPQPPPPPPMFFKLTVYTRLRHLIQTMLFIAYSEDMNKHFLEVRCQDQTAGM